MKAFFRCVLDHPLATIGLLLAVTLLSGWRLAHLRIETSLTDLLIEDLPTSRDYQAFKQQFGSEEIILIAVRSDQSIFTPSVFEEVEKLSDRVATLEGVEKVISLPETRKAMDLTGHWSLEDFEAAIDPVTLFRKNLISEDRKTAVICLLLKDQRYKDALIGGVERAIAEVGGNGLTVYQIGIPLVGQALEQMTLRDFKTLPLITLAIIGVILFLCFRSARGVLLPFATVVMSLFWTFGLMAWTDTPISMVTMIAPILLIACGTAYTLHILSHYFSLAASGRATREVVFETLQDLALPTLITSGTTIIGFGSLLVSRIESIQDFAFFSCAGIVGLVVGSFTLIPAVLVALPQPAASKGPRGWAGDAFFHRTIERVAQLNRDHQKVLLPLALVVSLVAAAGILRIQVETDALGCLKKSSSVRQRFTDIARDVAGSSPINVVLESERAGFWQEIENIARVEQIQAFLDTLEGVDKSISWVDYARLVRYATNQYDPEYYAAPRFPFEVNMGLNTLGMLMGQDILDRFADRDFTRVSVLLRTHLCSSKDFLETKAKIRTYLSEHLPPDVRYDVTGLSMAIAHSSEALTLSQVESLSGSLGLILMVMMLLFMSFRVGFIAILPNLFPIVVLFGIMGWFDIRLSLVTSLIASIAIGIAVDDTVHYLTIYNREFKKDWDKVKAMERTMLTVGKPITLTSVCIVAGFSILMLSSFQPTAVFGLLMVITMLTDMFGNLLILPSLMLHVELVTIWDLVQVRLGRDPQKRIGLFMGLSRRHMRRLILAGFLESFPAGATIFRKNDPADSMYAIIQGAVKVVDDSDGCETFIAALKQGEVFGEMGMIRSRPRSATVVAMEDTELLRINHRMFKRLHRLFPPVAHKFFLNLLVILCDRLEVSTQRYLGELHH